MDIIFEPSSLDSQEPVLYGEDIQIDKQDFQVKILPSGIYLISPKKEYSFLWQDVLGANKLKEKNKKKVEFYVYPIVSNERKFLKFIFSCSDPEKLEKVIQNMAYLGKMPEVYDPKYSKRFKVIINPNSGRGKAVRIWNRVSKFFTCCEVSVEYTERRNHASELVKELNLSDFDGLLVVSGDGLVHEVINALCTREDGDLARLFPVGIIPAGSANALAQIVSEKSGEIVSPESCSFIAIKGTQSPFDISQVKYESGQVLYSFLSIFWAFIADVDIESEKCRCCGSCRFDTYGFWRVLALRRYTGSVVWDSGRYDGNIIYFIACNAPFIGENMNVAPKAQIDDGMNDILMLEDVGRMQLIRLLLRQDSGNHIDNPSLRYYKTKKWELEPVGRPGIFSIDGELYPAEKISVEVLHKYCTVFLLK